MEVTRSARGAELDEKWRQLVVLVVTVTGWLCVNAICESRICCVASNVLSWPRSGCCKSWWIHSHYCTFPLCLV